MFYSLVNYSALINPDDFSTCQYLHIIMINFEKIIEIYVVAPENMNEEDSTVMNCQCYPQCNENMLDFHVDQSKTY